MKSITKKIQEFIKWYLNPYYWVCPYFLSFTEEAVMNPDYFDYIAGRVEVWTQWSWYDVDEWRFLTKDIKGFQKLRDKYELKDMTYWRLKKIRKIVEDKFHDKIK